MKKLRMLTEMTNLTVFDVIELGGDDMTHAYPSRQQSLSSHKMTNQER